jgi:murein DD-endopeptidase MepM/ murein hydrolase activator NlpD
MYKLHVTNFDKVPLTLSELQVFGDTDTAQGLESVSGDALAPMMVNVGSSAYAKETQTINPGARAVVFLWIALKLDTPIPHQLKHRMVFVSRDTGTATTRATLEDFRVDVSDGVAPVLGSPFRGGVWVAGDGPENDSGHRRSLLAIGGHAHAPERFASDWVKVGPNGDSHRGTARNEDYWAYGEPILAVADGEVTQLLDGIADNTPHELPQPVTLDNILGNHVILRIAPNLYVTYAYLQKGSIQVAPHQHVRCGTVIARLGNSGQATAPHLHLQVTDGNSGLEAEGVPFVFDRFTDFGPGATYEVNHHPRFLANIPFPGKTKSSTSRPHYRNGTALEMMKAFSTNRCRTPCPS